MSDFVNTIICILGQDRVEKNGRSERLSMPECIGVCVREIGEREEAFCPIVSRWCATRVT